MAEPAITFAHHHGHSHGRQGKPRQIVWHDEEYPLSDGSAEAIARYFAGLADDVYACAHYVVDATSEQHCVPDREIAYHAPPNTTPPSVGIERDGYASWSRAAWRKPKAQMTTCRQAARTAELCARHNIPRRYRSTADLLAGRLDGVTLHRNKTAAYHQSTHTDPGEHFPVAATLALVHRAYAYLASPEAVTAFQRSVGLTPDGVAGPKTLHKVTRALYGAAKPTPGVTPVPTPNPAPTPHPVHGHPAYTPEGTGQLRAWVYGPRTRILQADLGLPADQCDGYFGTDTLAAVLRFQAGHGLKPDGVVGRAMFVLLGEADRRPRDKAKAQPRLTVTGVLDGPTVRAVQRVLGRGLAVDGDWGPKTTKALQRHLGVRADGVVGDLTLRALQRHLHLARTGRWDRRTVRALQQALRAGTF